MKPEPKAIKYYLVVCESTGASRVIPAGTPLPDVSMIMGRTDWTALALRKKQAYSALLDGHEK